jgi:methoxymalonate biosynthesis acyl carrier protein
MSSINPAGRTDRRSRIRNFIANELVFDDEPLDDSTDVLALLDSQSLMQLVVFIEEDFKIQLDEQDFAPENFRTIGDIERLIEDSSRDRAG